MLTLVVALLGGYLLGSIPFGYVVGKLRGIDIRKVGSGNIGATNVVRVLGKQYGYPVFVLDFLKGFAAVKMSMLIATSAPPEWGSPEIVGIIAAIATVIGHSFPVWLQFRGGKGVATSAGALFGLMPLATVIALIIWTSVFWLTRYVSVASMVTAVALPLVILVLTRLNRIHGNALFYSSLGIAAIVIWRHHSNLYRLMHGSEPRSTRK
jgi:glycerol-3-phosphate acyltransferase PlsY